MSTSTGISALRFMDRFPKLRSTLKGAAYVMAPFASAALLPDNGGIAATLGFGAGFALGASVPRTPDPPRTRDRMSVGAKKAWVGLGAGVVSLILTGIAWDAGVKEAPFIAALLIPGVIGGTMGYIYRVVTDGQ